MFIKANDPLLSQQWHLGRIGLDYVYEQYRGSRIKVGVYDTGVQSSHVGLKQNYVASLEVGSGNGAGGAHGTAVAGIIAATANDGEGGIGIASEARLTGVNVFGASSDILASMQQMTRFDVVNNSWGWTERYSDGADTGFGRSFIAALEGAVANGRGGLGTIVVNSSGNDWLKSRVDSNSSEFGATRATITVGAVTDQDFVAGYTNRGANLLVSAPSSGGTKGIATTDMTGAAGYSSGDTTTTFGGTSAAAPIVSGVVALMLEANPNLGWRDVQSILALSAQHVGSDIDAGPQKSEAYGWTVNQARGFNGGGMHFSNDYGFGLVDARAAVRMAEIWSEFGAAKVSANELSVSSSVTLNKTIADKAMTSFEATIDKSVAVEHVELTLNLTHSDVNQLRIQLVSPSGTVSELLAAGAGAKESHINWNWTFGSEAFRGEDSTGTWTVRIIDTVTGAVGMVASAKVTAYGAAQTADDVYHFTDAFGALAAMDASRTVIDDTNWGTDWIDASATRAGVLVNLAPGSVSQIGGATLSTTGTTAIENVVGGEGSDVLIGNVWNNIMIGGRGQDSFVFAGPEFGADIIRDFTKGEDKIVFAQGPADLAEIGITETAAATIIVYGGSTITLDGFHGLDASDFRFNVDLAGLAPAAALELV
jgi:subtilisin-like proprotein convertase family protein